MRKQKKSTGLEQTIFIGDQMASPKVIAISGHAQNGKDTAAKYMKRILKARKKRFVIVHYADLLKYICRQMFDWNGEKDEKGRSILQYVGTDVIRAKNENYWVDFICDMMDYFGENWDYVIIPDTRFPNEINRLRERGYEVVHVRVRRKDFDNGLTDAQKNHPSETALDCVKADYYIENNGDKSNLFTNVLNLMREII